ncbi:MAG: hypothetical protein FJ030_17835 [Chloroflexi bacterium]|nr:hypothetical protein [Chloroflexota bacterium]
MPDLPLPLSFRSEIIELIAESIRAGESCALVGVGSSGKSNIVRFLRDRADAREHHFGDSARRLLWLMIDCNALDSYDEAGLFTAMIDSLTRAVAARSDLGALTQTLDGLYRESASPGGARAFRNLHRAIETVRTAGDFQFAFVLDDCDKLIQVAPPSLLRRLRALRDEFKYKLVYITATRRELHRLRPHSPEFESFFEIVVARSFAIGPYGEADARFMLDRLAARLPTPRALDSLESRMLVQATGGHGGLLKAAFFASRAGERALDPDLIDVLINDSSVMDECRKIWESLEEEDHEGLAAAVAGKPIGGEARNALMAKGLTRERTDGTHALFCPVFEAYVNQKAGLAHPERSAGEASAQSKDAAPPKEPRLDIYQGSRLVRIGGKEVNMTRAEFEVLCALFEKRGRDVRREDLLERVLTAETYEPSGLGANVDKTLDRATLELKAKLEARGFAKPIIVSAGGGGYRMQEAVSPKGDSHFQK